MSVEEEKAALQPAGSGCVRLELPTRAADGFVLLFFGRFNSCAYNYCYNPQSCSCQGYSDTVSLFLVPEYLPYAATCLPTCCESAVSRYCQRKEPAWVNLCLPLNAWLRSSLRPRVIYRCLDIHLGV